ncbi:MAG: hypothetical protein WA803_15970 [Steroidobacteraceae bacterium]
MSDSKAIMISSFDPATKGWYVGNYDAPLYAVNLPWENVMAAITVPIQTSVSSISSWEALTTTSPYWLNPFVLRTPLAQANTATTMAGSELRSGPATVATIPISESAKNRTDTVPAVEVIAEWDGYVEGIYADYFTASMQGLRGAGVVGEEEDAEIPISDVDPEDCDLLVPGGFFRLMIAYESPRVGPRKRYTTVQFRRLPAYTKREISAAEREADELLHGFRLEESSKSAGAR